MDTINAYAQAFEESLANTQAFTSFSPDIQHGTVVACMALDYAGQVVRLLSHELDWLPYGTPWFCEQVDSSNAAEKCTSSSRASHPRTTRSPD